MGHISPFAVPVAGTLGQLAFEPAWRSEEARRRYEQHCEAARALDAELIAKDLLASWKCRAAMLIEAANDAREFALIEEAFDDSPLNTDAIGQRFMLAALAGDEQAIARLRETLRAHAASKAARLAEAGNE